MFERTRAPVLNERWQKVYASRLDIGPKPPALRSYSEAEEEENKTKVHAYEIRPRKDKCGVDLISDALALSVRL
jgi:hypothetical protein